MSWATIDPRYRELAHKHLTDRQLEVLKLRLDGHSWAQIAAKLEAGESTVRGHHRAAIRRLCIELRKDAA